MATDPYRILAVVLSALTAGIAGMLVVWDPTETPLARVMLPSRMGSIPTWAGVAVIEFFAMGFSGVCSYVAARNHAAAVNWTALAGGVTMVTVATAAPDCNPAGSITAGLMIAAMFAGVGWVNWQIASNTNRRGANSGNVSTILFVRGSAAAYMVTVALVAVLAAISRDINADLLGAILIFCGLGVTAAATMKAKWSSRNMVALLGITISIVGAGIEMDRAFNKYTAPFETWHVLVVAAMISATLILPLALQTASGVTRNAGLLLVALFAGAFTCLMFLAILTLIIGTCGVALAKAPWDFLIVLVSLIGIVSAISSHVVIRRSVFP